MRPWSLRAKLFGCCMLVSGLVLCASFLAMRSESRLTLVRRLGPGIRKHAHGVAERYFGGRLGPDQRPEAADRLRGFAIFDLSGETILTRSTIDPDSAFPQWLREKALERDGNGTLDTYAIPGRGELRAFASVFRSDDPDQDPVLVIAFADLRMLDPALGEVTEGLAKSAPLALIVALTAAWLLTWQLMRPLSRMAADATRATLLEADSQIRVPGTGDELDVLADALNEAFSRLRDSARRWRQFTADAAHELRTPVTAIQSRAEVALRRDRSAAEYRAALDDILTVAERSGSMVEALLRLARLDDDETALFEDLDFSAVVDAELRRVNASPQAATCRVRRNATSQPCVVRGDAALLASLVRNLLQNAVTHGWSEDGVDVRVTCDAQRVRLDVEDYGEGVPTAYRERIFDRLHRVDTSRARTTGGAGLGLAIARAIAEFHGGTVSVAGEEREGTRMTVVLPSVGRAPEPRAG